MRARVFAIVSLSVLAFPAFCSAQQTGTGTQTNQLESIDVSESSINYSFEDIRREIRFVGPSSSTVVHPYTRGESNLQEDAANIGGRGDAGGAANAGGRNAAGTGAAGNSRFGGFNSPFEQLIASQFLGQNFGQTSQTPIRSTVRFNPNTAVGPKFVRPTVNQRSLAMTQKIRSVPGFAASNFQARFDKGTVTLTGTVDNEEQKSRLARLMKFEPGVWKVVNQLVVKKK